MKCQGWQIEYSIHFFGQLNISCIAWHTNQVDKIKIRSALPNANVDSHGWILNKKQIDGSVVFSVRPVLSNNNLDFFKKIKSF